jgi:nucleoside-diphosphate-sugar epimerase
VTAKRLRIAVLGATGHVGQVLAHHLPATGADVVLVGRDPDRVRAVALAADLGLDAATTFDALPETPVDVLVNCVGIGDPAKLAARPEAVYEVTQHFDDICLGYLNARPGTMLVNFSSGAVYGTDFTAPATDESTLSVAVNSIAAEDHYGIAKLASESRHRARPGDSIIDLRLFGLFSRYIDPTARYFANELVACVASGEEFVTGPDDMKRDFVRPADLAALVRIAAAARAVNAPWDVATGTPVSKFELLETFARRFGLRWRIDESLRPASATGAKTDYYSLSHRARLSGWEPTATSLETVVEEAAAILEKGGAAG